MSFSISRLVANVLKMGPRSAWKQLMSIGEVKAGTLVGTDSQGNEYYENKHEMTYRTRWVVPSSKHYDPSQIPAEWHMWIHKIDERSPAEANLPVREWMSEHTDNATGRSDAFRPYNTTAPKVDSWTPRVGQRGV